VDQACGEVESTKPVSDLFTPATERVKTMPVLDR
jgi:hypothetical protein